MFRFRHLDFGKIVRKRSFRRFFVQVLFLGLIFLLVSYIASRAFQLEFSYGYLANRAGFGISHTFIIDYTSNDSRWDAYAAGIINTVRLCLVGILLTTLLGTIMGIARLSTNLLVSKIAATYVEIIRNMPLLVQIVFWQIVFLQLPQISNALTPGGISILSNRGAFLPWVHANPGTDTWLLISLLGLIAATVLRWYLKRTEEITGKSKYPNVASGLLFLGICFGSFILMGLPLDQNIPSVVRNEFGTYKESGGFAITPEFTALLIALVLYTGTFISEIVRGSIQSLQKGQTEAAKALGLSNYQRTTLIILPQALRSIIPPLTNQYLNLTKNSSLAVVIAYPDLFMVSRTIMNNSGNSLQMFVLILATYLFLSLFISAGMNLLNRRVTRFGI